MMANAMINSTFCVLNCNLFPYRMCVELEKVMKVDGVDIKIKGQDTLI